MQGHIRSILPQREGVIPVDAQTAALFDYEESQRERVTGLMHSGREKAFYFDGASSAKITRSASLDLKESATIAAWVKTNSVGSYQHILCKGTGIFSLNIYQSKVYVKMAIGSASRQVQSTSTLVQDKWQHLAVSYANGEMRIYIDGVLDATASYATTDLIQVNSNDILIGAEKPERPINFMRGHVADIKVWNRALIAEEIKDAQNGGRQSTGLVGCWYAEEEDPTVLFDASPFGNDAVVTGSLPSEKGNAVFAKREKGILLEEATTNMIPPSAVRFDSGWSQHTSSSVTWTTGVAAPEWETTEATRIQTTGGTSTIKSHIDILSHGSIEEGRRFAAQVKVKNIGEKPLRVHANRGADYLTETDLLPGESRLVKWVTNSYPIGSGGNLQIQFRALAVEDNLDFLAYEPQIEEKLYSTSFVIGKRDSHYLRYPNPIKGASTFTLSCWVKLENLSGVSHNVLTLSPDNEQSLNGVYIDGHSDKWRTFTYDSASVPRIANSTRTVQPGVWVFLAVTRGDGRLTLYVDGVEANYALDGADVKLGDTLSIGQRLGGSSNGANFTISELRIDKVKRSADEIQAWYHRRKERFS